MLPTGMFLAAATTLVVLAIGAAVMWRLTTLNTRKLHKAAMKKALKRIVNNLRFIQQSIEWTE